MGQILKLSVVFLLLLASCAQPKDLQYQGIQNIRINSAGFSKTELGADVKFYNPNTYPMVLKEAVADVFINNKFIGNVKLDQTFNVPRKDTFLLPVLINADLAAHYETNAPKGEIVLVIAGKK